MAKDKAKGTGIPAEFSAWKRQQVANLIAKVGCDLETAIAMVSAMDEPKATGGKEQTPTVRAGQSGTVCVYGLGRFPIAVYPEQWRKIFNGLKDEILALCAEAEKDSPKWKAAVEKAKADSAAKEAKRAAK